MRQNLDKTLKAATDSSSQFSGNYVLQNCRWHSSDYICISKTLVWLVKQISWAFSGSDLQKIWKYFHKRARCFVDFCSRVTSTKRLVTWKVDQLELWKVYHCKVHWNPDLSTRVSSLIIEVYAFDKRFYVIFSWYFANIFVQETPKTNKLLNCEFFD